MKILDISAVTDASEMPLKSGTLQFLQDAPREVVAAIMTAVIGAGYNPATVYIIYGAQNSGTPPVYNINAGYAYYNGELFQIDAVSFTASGSNVGVFNIAVTQYTGTGGNADPVTLKMQS